VRSALAATGTRRSVVLRAGAVVLATAAMTGSCGHAALGHRSAGATTTPSSSATGSPSGSATAPSPAPAGLELPRPLFVVGLGDSVTAAAHCDCSGFVADYGVLLHRKYEVPVRTTQYGVSGGTTATLLAQLQGRGSASRAVAAADVVSVTIGANDLETARASYDEGTCGGRLDLACFTPAVARMRAGLWTDLAAVRSLTGSRPVQVLVNTYWNVFEDGAVALREDGRQYLRDSDVMTRRADAAICAAARAAGALCVDTYAPFKGDDGRTDPTDLLAPDGDHPDAAGHEVIARVMAAAGLPALLRP
jgi:lysophospholipase L1-like esterase